MGLFPRSHKTDQLFAFTSAGYPSNFASYFLLSTTVALPTLQVYL
jgi:hypothetical protein